MIYIIIELTDAWRFRMLRNCCTTATRSPRRPREYGSRNCYITLSLSTSRDVLVGLMDLYYTDTTYTVLGGVCNIEEGEGACNYSTEKLNSHVSSEYIYIYIYMCGSNQRRICKYYVINRMMTKLYICIYKI